MQDWKDHKADCNKAAKDIKEAEERKKEKQDIKEESVPKKALID